MTTVRWHAAVAGAVIIACVASLRADEPGPAGIHVGMTATQVRERLGAPVRIVRQVLYRRHIEQWVYENPLIVRIQFSCARGEEPVVGGIIPARATVSSRKG